MNYSKNNGWYYINENNKSPSWTGVEFLFEFLTSNKKEGPKGTMVSIDKLNIGDIIQLSFDGIKFLHTLIVIKNGTDIYNTQVSAHTEVTLKNGRKVGQVIPEGIEIKGVFLSTKNPVVKLELVIK